MVERKGSARLGLPFLLFCIEMKQLRFLLYLLSWVACCELSATPHNIASLAKVSCSSALTQEQGCENVVDQVIRIAGKGEWVAKTKLDFRGRVYPYPWIQLDWEEPIYTNQVMLYDRVDKDSHTAAGTLFFSDGSSITVNQIPNDGAPKVVTFETKK